MYLKNIIIGLLGGHSAAAVMGVDKSTAYGLLIVAAGALLACVLVALAESIEAKP